MRKSALTGAAILALTITVAACSGPGEDSMTEEPMSSESMSEDMGGEDMSGEDMGGEDMSGEDMGGEDMSGEDMEGEDMGGEEMADEDMSGEDMTSLTGMFEGQDGMVTGSVEISDAEIVLSDFSADDVPGLHLYLTNGTDEAAVAAGAEIDAVAGDESSQTFSLDGVDVTGYDTAVIYNDEDGTLLGAAALS